MIPNIPLIQHGEGYTWYYLVIRAVKYLPEWTELSPWAVWDPRVAFAPARRSCFKPECQAVAEQVYTYVYMLLWPGNCMRSELGLFSTDCSY